MRREIVMGVFLLFSAVGCGNNQWVKNVNVRTYNEAGANFGEVVTTINPGNMVLPDMEFPIPHPGHPGEIIGVVGLHTVNRLTDILIAVNIDAATRLGGCVDPTLPNGSPIPVGGIDASDLICLPVSASGIRVYLAFDLAAKQVMVGTAIPIKELDGIGGGLGGANVFPTFALPNGITGVFGVFTGRLQGQNGFALFVDGSRMLQDGLSLTASQSLATRDFYFAPAQDRQEDRVNRALATLNSRRPTLHIQ